MQNAVPMQVIAHIRSDFPSKFGIPRQSGLVDALKAEIIFEPPYRNPDAFRRTGGILPHLVDLAVFPSDTGSLVANRPSAPVRGQHPDGGICHSVSFSPQPYRAILCPVGKSRTARHARADITCCRRRFNGRYSYLRY